MRRFLLLATLAFIVPNCYAQSLNLANPVCGLTNDSTAHIPGASTWLNFTPPAVGGTYGTTGDDAVFGCTVTRLTNAATDPGASGEVNYYATTSVISVGDTYVLVFNQSGNWRVVATGATLGNATYVGHSGQSVVDIAHFPAHNVHDLPVWDYQQDNAFWVVTSGNVLSKCVINGTNSTTCTANHTFSEYPYWVSHINNANMSYTGWMQMAGQATQGASFDLFMYNPSTGVKTPVYTPASCNVDLQTTTQPNCIHGTGVFGEVMGIFNTTQGTSPLQNIWWAPPFTTQNETNSGDHGDIGFDLNGNFVGAYEDYSPNPSARAPCANFRPTIVSYSSTGVVNSLSCWFDNMPTEYGFHISYNDGNTRPWVVASMQGTPGGGCGSCTWGYENGNASYAAPSSGNGWQIYTDEIDLMRIDANSSASKIYRLALAHTRARSSVLDSTLYWADPKAAISRDGNYIIFTSNSPYAAAGCGSVSNPCTDVFMVSAAGQAPLFPPTVTFPTSGCAIMGSGPNWSCASGAAVTDVNPAITAMADGATLTFQGTAATPGVYSWGAAMPFSLTKGITVQCQTPGQCQVTQTGTSGTYYFGIPQWGNTPSGTTMSYYPKCYRISGFDWLSNVSTTGRPIEWGASNQAINQGTFTCIRIDNNVFNDSQTPNGETNGFIEFSNSGQTSYYHAVIDHNQINCVNNCKFLDSTGGIDPFPPPNSQGTINNMYFEDNNANNTNLTASGAGTGIIDFAPGNYGIVVRNNTSLNGLWTNHPTPMNFEFYSNLCQMNTLAVTNADASSCFHSQAHSSGEYFNNQFVAASNQTAPSTDPMDISYFRDSYKADTPSYPYSVPCDGFFGYAPALDVNLAPSATNQGYPCFKQPGRDPATFALTPFYSWGNTRCVSPCGTLLRADLTLTNRASANNPNYGGNHMQANRERYNSVNVPPAGPQTSSTSPWNCSTGTDMGFGPIGFRPTPGSCPTYAGEAGGGLGYAAQTVAGTVGASTGEGTPTDVVLYQLGTSGWTQYYKPFVYPHPFVSNWAGVVAGTAITAFPTVTLAPGPYQGTQTTTVSDSSPTPTLYCTTDGSTPRNPASGYPAGSTQTYSGSHAFSLSSTQTINCLAASAGLLDSNTLSAHYDINATAFLPQIPQPGSYPAGATALQIKIVNPSQLVKSCWTNTAGTVGTPPAASTPGTCSAGNSGGTHQFVSTSCAATCTIEALSTGVGFNNSAIVSATYTISGTNSFWWEDVGDLTQPTRPLSVGTQAVGTPSGTFPIYLNNGCPLLNVTGNCTFPTTSTSVSSVVLGGPGASAYALTAPTGSPINGVCSTNTANPVFNILASGTASANNPVSWCALLLTFTPLTSGTFNATLTITDTAAGSPHIINLTGTGAGAVPTATLTPSGLGFGNQNIHTTSGPQTATFTNTGTLPVIVNQAQTFNTAFTLTNLGTCFTTYGSNTSFTLPVGQSCTFLITFTPLSTGPVSSSLSVSDNASGSPQSISLTGTGTAPVIVWSSPQGGTTYNYGTVNVGVPTSSPGGSTCTTTPASCIELTNTGTGPLNVALTITGTNAAQFSPLTATTCGSTLAAGASCTATATFTPTSATTFTAFITETDSVQSLTSNVTLNGTGQTPPANIVAPWPVIIMSRMVTGEINATWGSGRNPYEIPDFGCHVTSVGWYGLCAGTPSGTFMDGFAYNGGHGL